VTPKPLGNIFLRRHEFPARAGVVKKYRFRQPTRHDFFIQQIDDEFNAYSGKSRHEDLPAVEAPRDDTPHPPFIQPPPYAPARRFNRIRIPQLIKRIEAAIENDDGPTLS
jgi:hypothetical protein